MYTLSWVQIQMWPFKLIILLGHNDRTRSNRFSFIILFIYRVFSQVRLDVIELAQMPTTTALITQTILWTMIHKINLSQLRCCFVKLRILCANWLVYYHLGLGCVELVCSVYGRSTHVHTDVEVVVLGDPSHTGFEFLLENGFGGGRILARCLGYWSADVHGNNLLCETRFSVK